jgi:hypothetical protein
MATDELTDEALDAQLDAFDPHRYWKRSDAAVGRPEPSEAWVSEAQSLHMVAVEAVAAFYAICEGHPMSAVAHLHQIRFLPCNTWHSILDKMEVQEPGSAAGFITRRGEGEWTNPYMRRLRGK